MDSKLQLYGMDAIYECQYPKLWQNSGRIINCITIYTLIELKITYASVCSGGMSSL